jgi:hypothetical protein
MIRLCLSRKKIYPLRVLTQLLLSQTFRLRISSVKWKILYLSNKNMIQIWLLTWLLNIFLIAATAAAATTNTLLKGQT